MTNYSILLQRSPNLSTIPNFCQPGFFFNEPEHIQQQTTKPFYLLTALNQSTGRSDARCAFFIDSDKALSPAAAPFGSIEFAKTLPDSVLDTFLNALIEAVRINGMHPTLRLVTYPCCYAPEQAGRLVAKLPEYGFQLAESHQTFYLPTTGNFEYNLVPAERRRLRKCRESGFVFQQWPSPNVTDVLNFLQETRQQRGYQLTISSDNLVNLLQKFPDRFLIFTISHGARIAALTVAVRVRDDILYSFMPASHSDYRTFSPMVLLTNGLFTYCQEQGIRILDLGTALDGNNQPKPSLIRFKRNLGAQQSPKLIFEKQF